MTLLDYIILLTIYIFECHGNAVDNRRLYNDIIIQQPGFNKFYPRPVENNFTEPVILYMNLSLSQILDVDEKNQIIHLNMWVYQEWYDYNLYWEPSDYNGIKELIVPQNVIWKPDLVLYNNAGGEWDLASSSNTKIHVYYNSQIVWKPPIIFVATCEIDVQFFPFDTQICTLKMGTWSYDGKSIDLRHTSQKSFDNNHTNKAARTFDPCESSVDYAIDLRSYQDNAEWDLLKVSAKRNIVKYLCCKEFYLDITYKIVIRRKTLFYGVNLILPCMSISLLAIMSFYLPSDSQGKISLSSSILIALTVFIMLVFELTPSTSLTVPHITKYLLFTIILVTASILASIFILNIRYKFPAENTILPRWIRHIFIERLPRYLFFMKYSKRSSIINLQYTAEQYLQLANLNNDQCEEEEEGEEVTNSVKKLYVEDENGKISVNIDIKSTFCDIRSIGRHLYQDSIVSEAQDDWKFVALVLDRMFLILFSCAVFMSTICFFLLAPSLKDTEVALFDQMAEKLQDSANYTRHCK